jgi:deoxyribodipyrimidine photo-lyase
MSCRFYAAKQGARIFHKGGPAGLSQLPWSSDPELWQRWSTGTTGMPLVDANMRELLQTGEGGAGFDVKHWQACKNTAVQYEGTGGISSEPAPIPTQLPCSTLHDTVPLSAACVHALVAAGWMSNRGRQNVASYLALDLGVDWRRGADLFEHLLLDYDVASNWGNWVSAAGLTGGRLNHFNITKQSKDYDPEGNYIRHWLPELAHVPANRIHQPW